MIFGGLQKNSLIDYPGKISCVLFLSGCNFECPYCHNPDLAKGYSGEHCFLSENHIYEFLENRKGLLEGVVISGGEPTLHKELFLLCEKIKKMGYPVKIDTNGSRPWVIKKLIKEELADYIAMDIKTDPSAYSPLIRKDYSNPKDILSSIRMIMESGLPYEFKTTCIKPLIDRNILEKICNIIKGANLYALQQFHFTDVLHPEFFRENSFKYDDSELIHLKSVADPWVKKCIVR